MPDIAKCKNEDCIRKNGCYRYTSNPDVFMQTYGEFNCYPSDSHFWNTIRGGSTPLYVVMNIDSGRLYNGYDFSAIDEGGIPKLYKTRKHAEDRVNREDTKKWGNIKVFPINLIGVDE